MFDAYFILPVLYLLSSCFVRAWNYECVTAVDCFFTPQCVQCV